MDILNNIYENTDLNGTQNKNSVPNSKSALHATKISVLLSDCESMQWKFYTSAP